MTHVEYQRGLKHFSDIYTMRNMSSTDAGVNKEIFCNQKYINICELKKSVVTIRLSNFPSVLLKNDFFFILIIFP